MMEEKFFSEKVPLNIPEMKIGTKVYINNRQHPLNLEQGIIVKRGHCQYRVKLVSQDPKITGKCLWFPEHWVEPLPKEF